MLLEYFVHRYAKKVGKNFGKINKRTLELFRVAPVWMDSGGTRENNQRADRTGDRQGSP